MIKKVMASAAMAASVVGVPAATAPQAQAAGTDNGTTAVGGHGAARESGAPAAFGDPRPQTALLRGALRTPCVGLPARADVGSVVGLVPAAALQDLPVPSGPPNPLSPLSPLSPLNPLNPLNPQCGEAPALSSSAVGAN
ncbi:MAG TPA: rodlin [Streptomyces sp.]|nr:rodlin [Streptomyces sp.]